MSLARAHHSAAPAAPAGGARIWIPSAVPSGIVLGSGRGWGCGTLVPIRSFVSLIRNTQNTGCLSRRFRGALRAAVMTVAVTTAPAMADVPRLMLPSGTEVLLQEVLLDPSPTQGTAEPPWARFRFVAPDLRRDGAGQTHAAAATDMDHLCRAVVRPYLDHHQLATTRVVISLADRALPFGQAAPEASQFFESYQLVDGQCVWEGY